jgi:hypothetical protein
VSSLRPAARVDDVAGQSWEIYAYRFRLPRRSSRGFRATVRWLVRAVVDVPRAAREARRSDDWTIEAISWLPRETRYTWRTTTEYRGNVLAQIEAGIAAGEIPRPRFATFIGTDL